MNVINQNVVLLCINDSNRYLAADTRLMTYSLRCSSSC